MHKLEIVYVHKSNELVMTRIFWKKTYQIVDESKSESDVNVVEGHTEGRQHVKQGHLGPHHVDDRKYRNLVNIIFQKSLISLVQKRILRRLSIK
jgi:hypothetical protein